MMSEQLKAKRMQLIELSNAVKKEVEQGKYPNINTAIIERFYKSEQHYQFKSFQGWRKEGKQVQKGQKGFIVWGRPKSAQDEEKGAPPPDDEKSDFYPIAYVFSNSQVQ